MVDHEPEKRMRRRSRTVSWDHSVRSGAGDGASSAAYWVRATGGVGPVTPQGPTSPGLRDSSVTEPFENMSISRGHSVEKVRFSASRAHSDENDEDYSASVNAILHKRLSVRKGKHQKQRRSSSPVSSMIPDDASLLSDRRRSSAFTTSSGDTAINIEDTVISQEQIFENIRLHKEVLGSVRQQPMSIRRKMKLVQQAKEYVKKHEGQLQERLAMSKSTRDILARFNILVVKQWQHSKREVANFISQIIPWELTIKEIESQFGTVVASYFTFLRWLFWVNFVISVLLAAFVVIPEILITKNMDTGERKTLLPEEEATSMHLMTLLNFEGVLQYSPMFYGYYSNHQSSDTGYRLPTAYFITGLVVYIYSFVATLRKMATNSRLSKLSEKDDECIFTWKLFTGWDYMIGNEETAHNRISSIILGFKEALLEEAERMKDNQNWKIIALRVFANLNMIWMLGSSVYAVIFVVGRSTDSEAESTPWRKYEITVVMTLIGTFFPIAFEGLGVLESYHPRTTLRVQLARIMALNLLNLYTLTFALFVNINGMTKDLLLLKPTLSNVTIMPTATSKITSTTSIVMAVVLLNSTLPMTPLTTPTTATTFSPTVDSNYSQPNYCYEKIVDCPLLLNQSSDSSTVVSTLTTVGPAHVTLPAVKTSIAADINATDGSTTTTTTTGFDSSEGTETGLDDRTFSTEPASNANWNPSSDPMTDKMTPDKVSDTVEYVSISSNIVNDTSSEDTATEWNFQVTSDILTVTRNGNEEPTEDPMGWMKTESDSKTESTGTEPTSSPFAEPTPSSFAEPTPNSVASETALDSFTTEPVKPILDTESAPMVDRDSMLIVLDVDGSMNPDTTSTQSVTVNKTLATDRPDDDGASSERRRMKRTPEVLYNGKYCYVCLPRPPTTTVSNVTEAPKSYQGFSEKSSEAYMTTTEHEDAPNEDLSLHATCLDLQTRRRLRKLCWETMFGQELVKLTVMDLVSTIISTIFVDFARAVFVRYMNRWWCWNLEKRFPQYGDFKIAENILHLVNNQGMVWMGMFFSPGLPIINVVKLMIMMYVRSWAVLTCNVPHDVVFRASRSNNFYLGLLLTMLFLCVLPVGYAIVWIEPSWHCGPFSQYKKIYHIFTNSIKKAVPNPMVHRVLDYIASPAIVIPLLLLLILIIYYLASLTSSLREANNDLKTQLRRERTEERRKMFQLVNSKKHGDDDDDYTCMDTTLAKWRQIMPDSKAAADRPNFMFEFAEKKLTENDVLDKVREKLVHMEADDQQPEKNTSGQEVQQQPQQQQQHLHHHHHHHHQQHMHHHHHLRRPSRSEEPRDMATLRKWKKPGKPVVLPRRQSSESESSDQSDAVPEIRVVKSCGEPVVSAAVEVATAETVKARGQASGGGTGTIGQKSTGVSGEPVCGAAAGTDVGGGAGSGGEQPVKQRARLKLAQILYKEARRRRQKYVEELQNQQE